MKFPKLKVEKIQGVNMGLGAQMGAPICHRSKVPIYSKSLSKIGNYN